VNTRSSQRGIALLTVITALVALMIIAVPFAITMRMGYERSVHHNARSEAKNQVDSVLRFLEAYAVRTTERVELENRANDRKDLDNADPEMDTAEEFTPTLGDMSLALNVTQEEITDGYGTNLGWEIEDENGKLNLNTCSFFALGNMLGLSRLSKEIEPSATIIQLDDASQFPDRGYVKIGRELVKYGGKDGNALIDCERGIAAAEPHHGKALKYNKKHWVVNYAAWAISYYPVYRHPGEFTEFQTLNVGDISRLTELDPEIPVLTQADWERVRPFVTIWSKGELADGWANMQELVEQTRLPSKDLADFERFNFYNGYYYNIGTVIRFQEKTDTNISRRPQKEGLKSMRPLSMDYSMVFLTKPVGVMESQMELFGKVHRKFRGNKLRIQYRTRQPVNINTAPREVLVALFSNLGLKGHVNQWVTPEEAGKVADKIIARRESDTPLRSMEGFRDMLRSMVSKTREIQDQDFRAIYRNSLNSHDGDLVIGTAPICFRTFDVYTLRATAQVADVGGRLLAKHDSTRVVEIGSQMTTSRGWDTQRDLEEQLVLSNDTRWWTTGPVNTGTFIRNDVEPWPRWPKQLSVARQFFFPWDPYDKQSEKRERPYGDFRDKKSTSTLNGDARLSPARMAFDDAFEDPRFVEHFDQQVYVEGFFAENGYLIPLTGEILDNAVFEGKVQPFTVQFWWQPRTQSSGNPVIFDVGEGDFRNRYTCYVDSDRNELVFAVKDNTLIDRNCEIRYDLEAQRVLPETWYHVQLIASGCHPSKMAMIIDGRAVGETTLLTRLTSSLAEDDSSVPVENASGFPARGALLIGQEVVEYESRSDNSFVVRTNDSSGTVEGRGRRGTKVDSHADGTPVVLFGYSRPIVEGLRKGGVTLDSEVGPWGITALALTNDWNPDIGNLFENYDPPKNEYPDQQVSAGGGGLGGEEEQPSTVTIYSWSSEAGTYSGFTLRVYGKQKDSDVTVEDQLRGFHKEGGYAFMIFIGGTEDDFANFVDGGRDNCKARVELVYYPAYTGGDTITFERMQDNDGLTTAPEKEGDLEILLGAEQTNGSGDTFWIPSRVYLMPCSVTAQTADLDAYLNPATHDDANYWVAQLLSDPSSDVTKWEWFRYSEAVVGRGKTHFVQARVPNIQLLTDASYGKAGWDQELLDIMAAEPPDSGGDGGAEPGGEDDPSGGGGSGGGGGGGLDPSDPPTAPPSDGPGGNDPGGDPEDGTPSDDGPGGNDPGGEPEDGTPTEDGPGGNDPGGEPEEGTPTEDGPGGNDPGGEPEDGTPTEDGAGGNIPSGPPDGGVGPPTETPDEGDDDIQEPSRPEGSGAGEPLPDSVANVLRFRGVQSDLNGDGRVNDWWGRGLDGPEAFLDATCMVNPVAGVYGGPIPEDANAGMITDGEENTGLDFSIWPMPGNGDNITLMTGDDSRREGGKAGDVTVHWAMTSTNERLYDITEPNGTGEVEPYEYDVFMHLIALNDSLDSAYPESGNLDVRKADQRDYTRICAFPTGEMMDNIENLSPSRIGVRWNGDVTPCVIDEISGENRNVLFPLTLTDEELSDTATVFSVTSSEGTPDEADIPEAPGLVRIGDELCVFGQAEVVGGQLQFSDVTRGVLRTLPGTFERGAPVEVLFGCRVAILLNGVTGPSNILVGRGFRRFPPMGVVRMESPESDQADLRLYTLNKGTQVQMPVNDTGAGIFTGRYGTNALSFEGGTPVFFHPVRVWDRYAESSNDPQLSYWSFSTQLSEALIKRIYWEEGQRPKNVQFRVFARVDEAAPWEATTRNILWLSQDTQAQGGDRPEGEEESLRVADRRTQETDDPRRFLYAMERKQGDNLLNLQANKIEVRVFVVYRTGAYQWSDPSVDGWKGSPIMQSFSIEYLQQNVVRRHIDR
jgi:hypothetical protein